MPNAETPAVAGSSILIPLPTATPTPENFELTADGAAERAADQPARQRPDHSGHGRGRRYDQSASPQSNATTLLDHRHAQPAALPSPTAISPTPAADPTASSPLRIGDCCQRPSADADAHALADDLRQRDTDADADLRRARSLIFPPQDGSASARTFQLEWVSAGVLKDKEVYLVEIQDETAGDAECRQITTSTSYDLPDALVPTDGQTHTIHWRVSVAAPNDQGRIATSARLAAGAPSTGRVAKGRADRRHDMISSSKGRISSANRPSRGGFAVRP